MARPLSLRGQDAWRRHPIFTWTWLDALPGIREGTAAFGVFVACEWAYSWLGGGAHGAHGGGGVHGGGAHGGDAHGAAAADAHGGHAVVHAAHGGAAAAHAPAKGESAGH